MYVIIKTQDITLQPRVIKVIEAILEMNKQCSVVYVSSKDCDLTNLSHLQFNENFKAIDISAESQRFGSLMKLNFVKQLIKLFVLSKTIYSSRNITAYLVHDYISLCLVVVLGFFRRGKSKIFYMGDELDTDLASHKDKLLRPLLVKSTFKHLINKCATVFQADFYRKLEIENKYKVNNVKVLRNVPKLNRPRMKGIKNVREVYDIPDDYTIFVYHGVISPGRGIERSMRVVSALSTKYKCTLVVVGYGARAYIDKINKYSDSLTSINKKFIFYYHEAINHNELFEFLVGADIGLVLIENICLSYYLSAPSKLYEYMMIGLPVIASDFPEIRLINNQKPIGITVDPHNENEIINAAEKLMQKDDCYQMFKNNALALSRERYNWEYESKELKQLLCEVVSQNKI